MSQAEQQNSPLHTSITATLWVAVMLLLFSACVEKNKKMAPAIQERDSLPAMKTLGVTTLVSDSGITRYRITTEEWLMFDKKVPSYWAFEKGINLEKFDSIQQVDASVKADTAYYLDKKKLWDLRGNVHIKSLKGDQFDTQQLFWDQNTQRVYSNKFIRIIQPDRVIEGYGFDSNQQMTQYTINNMTGIFYVDEEKTPPANDTIQ